MLKRKSFQEKYLKAGSMRNNGLRQSLIALIACILFYPCLSGAQAVRDGYGKMTMPDGALYEGQFKDGVFEGKGTLTYDNGVQYSGEFKNGLYDGKGILIYTDTSKYEGQFKEGQLNGLGVITYADGTQYKGKFKDGDMELPPKTDKN